MYITRGQLRARSGLQGPLGDLWRYRIGDYRDLCDIQDGVLVVLVLQFGIRCKGLCDLALDAWTLQADSGGSLLKHPLNRLQWEEEPEWPARERQKVVFDVEIPCASLCIHQHGPGGDVL